MSNILFLNHFYFQKTKQKIRRWINFYIKMLTNVYFFLMNSCCLNFLQNQKKYIKMPPLFLCISNIVCINLNGYWLAGVFFSLKRSIIMHVRKYIFQACCVASYTRYGMSAVILSTNQLFSNVSLKLHTLALKTTFNIITNKKHKIYG